MTSVIARVLFLVVFWMVALIGNAQAQTTVTVSTNPLWTDTGLVLASGDQVTITASGSWSWGIIGSTRIFVGPEGGGSSLDVFQRFDDNALGRLIGFVGSDPWQGHFVFNPFESCFFPQTSGYISVGSGTTFTAPPTGGKLWLGFNDDACSRRVDDNQGSVTAVISVGPLPPPLPPPTISGVSPLSGIRGQTISFEVDGNNFQQTSTLRISGGDITVNSYGTRESGRIVANISILPTATIGFRDVIVRNPDGQKKVLPNGFRIAPDVLISSSAHEPSLAVDPTDPNHAVVGFNDDSHKDDQGKIVRQCGWAETRDGGATWTNRDVLRFPAGFKAQGDPWLRYTPDGKKLFYSCMGVSEFHFERVSTMRTRHAAAFVARSQTGFASDFEEASKIPDSDVTQECFYLDLACEEERPPLADHPAIDVLRLQDGGFRLVACWVAFPAKPKPSGSPDPPFAIRSALRVASAEITASNNPLNWSSPMNPIAASAQTCTIGGGSSSSVVVTWWNQLARRNDQLKFLKSNDGINWPQPSSTLPELGGLFPTSDGREVSTTNDILSPPYVLITSDGSSGPLRAIWQDGDRVRNISQVFIGQIVSGRLVPTTSLGTAGTKTFLPGAGSSCPSLAGAYEVTGVGGAGRLNYKLWDAGRDSVNPIFVSNGSINPFRAPLQSNYPPFHTIGDYTSVDCSGGFGFGWAVWTADIGNAQLGVWGARVVVPR